MSAQTSTETWCPQCGPGVPSDGFGCCGMCGTTCTGPGAEQALDSVKRIAELEGRVAELEAEAKAVVSYLRRGAGAEFCLVDSDGRALDSVKRIAELERHVAQLEREAKAVVAWLRNTWKNTLVNTSTVAGWVERGNHIRALASGELDEWLDK